MMLEIQVQSCQCTISQNIIQIVLKTGSLWFYFKDEATSFNVDIENTDYFKSLKYKAKLKENTDEEGANEILKNATIAVSLKCLSNF